MKNKGLVIGVLLLLAGGAFFGYSKFFGKNFSKSTSTETPGMQSIKDLLASGTSQKCTFTTTDGSTESSGTTYVSGGKVRSDYTMKSPDKTVISHMINDEKTSYMWTDGEKTGLKMMMGEDMMDNMMDEGEENVSKESSQESLDQKVDYRCSAWKTDSSVFTPPSNVEFSEFTNMMMQTSSPSSGGSNSSQCSYCNSLTGDDKTQCLTALKCS